MSKRKTASGTFSGNAQFVERMFASTEGRFIDSFNDLGHEANATAKSKGFNNAKTNELVQIALMHAELGEATEAYRKDLIDDHIPEFKGIEAELADTVIRIMNMAAAKKLRVAEAIIAKMKYNKSRPFRHGGKKV